LIKKSGIIQNWSLLTTASFIQTGLNFICLVRIARILLPADYGRYTFLITAVIIAEVIATLGLRNVSIREIARNPTALPSIARKTSKVILIATMLAGSVLVGYTHFHEIQSVVLLLAVSFIF